MSYLFVPPIVDYRESEIESSAKVDQMICLGPSPTFDHQVVVILCITECRHLQLLVEPVGIIFTRIEIRFSLLTLRKWSGYRL